MNKEGQNGEVYNLYESSEEFRDAVKKLAAIYKEPIEQVLVQLEKACGTVVEQVGKAIKDIAQCLEPLRVYSEGIRPPSRIKKELKHEKNPMMVKQLNRELNESYRWYRGKRW